MYKFFFFFAAFTILAPKASSQGEILNALHEKWTNAANFTIECAELMPESKYNYSPVPEEMSFQKQLLHILQNMVWLSTDYLDAEAFEHNIRNADPSKAELIQLLRKGFNYIENNLAEMSPHRLNEKVDFFAGEKTRLQIIILLDDHLTHHRGQLTVYLRLNGIKPPPYRGW